MHKLLEYVCDEMKELEEKVGRDHNLSMSEVQYLDTLAHTKKNLLKAEEMEEDSEYSSAPYMEDRDNRSYARRRDSMGRYSRRYSMDGERDDYRRM